jgi:hypothetical protein
MSKRLCGQQEAAAKDKQMGAARKNAQCVEQLAVYCVTEAGPNQAAKQAAKQNRGC